MKASHRIAAALFVLLGVATASVAREWGARDSGEVHVRVLDMQTERPLRGVRVEVRGAEPTDPSEEGYTDSDGLLRIEELRAGRYLATVFYGSTWRTQRFELRDGERETLTFEIPHLKGEG